MESVWKILLWIGLLNLLTIAQINASTSSNGNENSIPVENTDIIQTNSGPIIGIKSKVSDEKKVNIYYGIPFAQPPLGELRFQPPRPTTPWTSTLQAVKPTTICYQDITEDFGKFKEMRELVPRPWSENCLVLNIWTPDPKPERAKVMVFIHGGAFILGSSLLHIDGSSLALEGIIVVSMNYRLGVFGFLGLGQPDAPGNVGLMDQTLAMQWVKNNIGAFGGDSEDITLMGMSAGSGSVGYHLLSPTSKGLFQRSVMMSGAPTAWWGIREPEENVVQAKVLADKVGCPSQNTTAILECLRSKHPEDILDGSRTKSFFDLEHFIPTVDGTFIVEHPSISVITGRFNPGTVIMGTAGDEGGTFMVLANPRLFSTKDGRLKRKDFLRVIKRSHKGMSDLQAEALNVVYTDWSNPDDPIMLRDASKEVYSDVMFNCHVNHWADNIARSGNTVYRYVFDHKYEFMSKFSEAPSWMGTSHGSDQVPVLGPRAMLEFFAPVDQEVTKKFNAHFINYIKTGDPNLSAEEFPEEPAWPKYSEDQDYKHIAQKSSIKQHLKARECAAWMKLLPILEDKQC